MVATIIRFMKIYILYSPPPVMYCSLFAVTASAQELITCYQRDMCFSSGLDGVTIQDCCDNINGGGPGGVGLGASFELDGTCTPCPVG